jgi:hypothetical protein
MVITCECGSTLKLKSSLKRHLTTKKHKAFCSGNVEEKKEEPVYKVKEEKELCNETKLKLKQLLDNCNSNRDYVNIILQLPTLKEAHIYCKYNNLSGQFTGPVLEKYIEKKYKMTKNNASSCNGDLKCNETNIEIKASNGGKENNKFNYVQIRMNHNCEYILTAYYLDYENLDTLGEMYIFRISKEDMKHVLLQYGGYAHGTISELGKITIEDLNEPNNRKEYVLRPKYNDKCWNYMLQFRIAEDSI